MVPRDAPVRLSAAVTDLLLTYDWPRNVRELERLIQRVVALSGANVIELEDLPPTIRGDYAATLLPSLQRDETVRAWRRRYARLVLDRCHGNKRQACPVALSRQVALTSREFDRWLVLFHSSVDAQFAGSLAAEAKLRASRIATVMQHHIAHDRSVLHP